MEAKYLLLLAIAFLILQTAVCYEVPIIKWEGKLQSSDDVRSSKVVASGNCVVKNVKTPELIATQASSKHVKADKVTTTFITSGNDEGVKIIGNLNVLGEVFYIDDKKDVAHIQDFFSLLQTSGGNIWMPIYSDKNPLSYQLKAKKNPRAYSVDDSTLFNSNDEDLASPDESIIGVEAKEELRISGTFYYHKYLWDSFAAYIKIEKEVVWLKNIPQDPAENEISCDRLNKATKIDNFLVKIPFSVVVPNSLSGLSQNAEVALGLMAKEDNSHICTDYEDKFHEDKVGAAGFYNLLIETK